MTKLVKGTIYHNYVIHEEAEWLAGHPEDCANDLANSGVAYLGFKQDGKTREVIVRLDTLDCLEFIET